MTHRRLFAVEVRHEYFAGAACPDVELAPRAWHPDGARALARHRLLARPRPGGLDIIARVDTGGDPWVALAPDLRITFDLRVTGSEFAHYTDLRAWPGAPLYRGAEAGELVLSAGPPTPPEVAASVEITGVAPTWLAAPPTFFVTLPAPRPLWVFYAFTTRTGEAVPEIRDADPMRALGFTRAPLAPDSPSSADDPVGHRLAAGDPARRGHRFVSVQPVTVRRAPVRQLGLYLGDDLLLRELPNPSIHSHATLRVEPTPEPRESLFRVLEY